jgi:hypothetical protein
VNHRLDHELPEFTEREQALLAAWDERNAPPAAGAFHDHLLAAYRRAEEASLRSSDAADEAICLQMACDAALVDARNDLGGHDGIPRGAVAVDVASVVRRADPVAPSRLRGSAKRRVLVATAVAAAAAVVAASLGPRSEVPAPAPPRTVSAAHDTHGAGAGAGATIPSIPRLEVNPRIAVTAGRGFTSPTIELQVRSMPPDADVLLDDRMIGRTPLVDIVSRGPGTAKLKLRLAHYKDHAVTVDLSADSIIDIALEPVPPPRPRVAKLPRPLPCNGETSPACKDVNQVNEPSSRGYDLVRRAIALGEAGDHAGAIEIYKRVWGLMPVPLLLANIATEYEQDGNTATALRYYCSYLEHDPDGVNAPYATARARLLHARLESERGNGSKPGDDMCAADAAEKPHNNGVGSSVR